MMPRSVEDLERRNQGLSRISEATVGLMGRTPDYMNVKFACFAARPASGPARTAPTRRAPHNLVAFQKRLSREDLSLTHTIIQPTIDKGTDPRILGNKVTLHKVGDTATGSSCAAPGSWPRSPRSPTRSPCTRRCRFPPAPSDYALAFAIPVDTPGLMFLCRDSASAPGAHPFDRPLSTPLRRAGRVRHLRRRRDPRERVFLDGRVDIYNGIRESGSSRT